MTHKARFAKPAISVQNCAVCTPAYGVGNKHVDLKRGLLKITIPNGKGV